MAHDVTTLTIKILVNKVNEITEDPFLSNQCVDGLSQEGNELITGWF